MSFLSKIRKKQKEKEKTELTTYFINIHFYDLEESPFEFYFKGSYVTFTNMKQIKNPYAIFYKNKHGENIQNM